MDKNFLQLTYEVHKNIPRVKGLSSMYGLLFDIRLERVNLLLPSKFIINVIFFSLDKKLT